MHAWPSYVLGAEVLFSNEPTIQMGVWGDGNVMEGGNGISLDISVTVKDGERVAEVDAAKVAAMFKCTANAGDWTDAAALETSVTSMDSQEGELRYRVGVSAGTARCAFLRIVP